MQTIHEGTGGKSCVQKLTRHTTHTLVIDLHCGFCDLGYVKKDSQREKGWKR